MWADFHFILPDLDYSEALNIPGLKYGYSCFHSRAWAGIALTTKATFTLFLRWTMIIHGMSFRFSICLYPYYLSLTFRWWSLFIWISAGFYHPYTDLAIVRRKGNERIQTEWVIRALHIERQLIPFHTPSPSLGWTWWTCLFSTVLTMQLCKFPYGVSLKSAAEIQGWSSGFLPQSCTTWTCESACRLAPLKFTCSRLWPELCAKSMLKYIQNPHLVSMA